MMGKQLSKTLKYTYIYVCIINEHVMMCKYEYCK